MPRTLRTSPKSGSNATTAIVTSTFHRRHQLSSLAQVRFHHKASLALPNVMSCVLTSLGSGSSFHFNVSLVYSPPFVHPWGRVGTFSSAVHRQQVAGAWLGRRRETRVAMPHRPAWDISSRSGHPVWYSKWGGCSSSTVDLTNDALPHSKQGTEKVIIKAFSHGGSTFFKSASHVG